MRADQLDGDWAASLAAMKVVSMVALLAWREELLKAVWKGLLMAHELDGQKDEK